MATDLGRVGREIATALAALALTGCKPAAPTAPTTTTCEQVGAALGQALAAERAQAGTTDPSAPVTDQAVVQAVVESCAIDAWTAAARTCFAATRTEAADRCRTEISDAQAQALDDRMASAVAKALPAECRELAPLIQDSLATDLAEAPPEQRVELEAKIAPFAAAVGAQCDAGWSVEARTCVRDAARVGADAGRCTRWLDEPQRKAYLDAVEAAFGKPPEQP